MSDMNTVFTHNPNCLVREVGDGIVIMPPEGEVTHTLGNLEGFIWGKLDGTNDQQAVLAAIMEQYDVPEDVAREDLLAFTAQLQTVGLITGS
jgi:hypothetical protein